MSTHPETRIPLQPNSTVNGTDNSYIIEQFCFATKYALVYLAHPESSPENRCVLMELYPRADVRMGGFVHRTDEGHIQIYSPFSAILSTPNDNALLDIYLDGLYEEVPSDPAFEDPVLFTDTHGGHYLVINPSSEGFAQDSSATYFHNPLPLIPEDELVSYVLLHKYPLYRYRDENGEIHILCIGSGIFMQQMILSILSCGQMLDTTLHIHILSKDTEQDFTDNMLCAAPLLKRFSNLVSEGTGHPVLFHYRQIVDIEDESILTDLPYARYILVSLGNSDRNRKASITLAQGIASNPVYQQRNTIILYHGTKNTSAADRRRLPQWIKTEPFSEKLFLNDKAVQDLGRLTVRLAHMYNKLRDHRVSLAKTEQNLLQDAYGQKSSCAAALHLNYKLASIGIDPLLPLEEIIPAYQQALQDPIQYARLISNEHFRWLFYMVSDQYQTSSAEDLLQHGFAYEGNLFNGSWKNKTKRLHPCLVPCSDEGIVLTAKDFQTYTTREAIEGSSLDPLDKTSLMLHLLAEKKCRDILRNKDLSKDFLAVSIKLLANKPAIADVAETLQNKLAETEQIVIAKASSLQYSDHKELDRLLRDFAAESVDISKEILQLKNTLSIFMEYAERRDYKKPDETIVQMLPWVLYGEDLKLIMLCNKTVSASITTPLLMDPLELVFIGAEDQPAWRRFFQDHGLRSQIRFVPLSPENTESLENALRREVAQSGCKCVVDITDANEVAVLAAHRLCLEREDISLIRATDNNCIENVQHFPPATAYSLNTALSAEDIFALHGARKIPEESRYMEQLCDLMPVLWEMYEKYKADWNMISAFFASPKAKPAELYMHGLILNSSTPWERYEYRVDRKKFKLTRLEDCLQALEANGLLKNLQVIHEKRRKETVVRLIFHFPNSQKNTGNILNRFFEEILPKASGAYTCHIWEEMGCWSFELSNGRKLFLEDHAPTFRDNNMNTYSYQQIFPVLKYMQEKKLLHEVSVSDGKPVKISFSYAHPELRTCLGKAGNLLEFHIFSEAHNTGFFDDIDANFTFIWKEETVKNELDLILTSGFKNLFISAKSGGWKKEQLYEIKYLTQRFSVNSIPVIIYSSDKVFEDGRISRSVQPLKDRAKAMGVHLIDLNDLDCPLGEKLVQITNREKICIN